MKKILSLFFLFVFTFSLPGMADDVNWRIHPIFDEEVTHVVETPKYVYFTSRQMMKNNTNDVYTSLFRYDKEGEELMPLSTSNILNANSVRDIMYNPDKGYVVVLYKDYEIDFISNNGKVKYFPHYAESSPGYSKNINSMTIDPDKDRLYMATDFGYLAINDEKNEVAESRIYGEPLMGFARMGEDYIILHDNTLKKAPVSSPRLSIDQYEAVETVHAPLGLYALSDNLALLLLGENDDYHFIKKLIKTEDGYSIENLTEGRIYNIEYNKNGISIAAENKYYQISTEGVVNAYERPEGYGDCAAASEGLNELWIGKKRKGLSSLRRSGEQWNLSRDWMLPNAPSPFASTDYINHPSLGFLVLSYGYTPPTYNLYNFSPYQLSSYKQGRWTNLSHSYTNPGRGRLLTATNGMVLDPDNSNYLYVTTYHEGLVRLNLKDPYDVLHLSRPNDPDNGKEGFAVLPGMDTSLDGYSNISPPRFDKAGNLWMYHANWEAREDPKPYFFVWKAADRKASTSVSNVVMPELVEFDVHAYIVNLAHALPLLKTGNGLIVFVGHRYNEQLVLIDTNGTPTDTSDDRIYNFNSITDSDGNTIELSNVRQIWEDPSTGYVWLCHGNGVCYFVPSQTLAGNYQVNRVKVPRNDGTNLADYLLEGVAVNHLSVDSEGRKWFATAGGGIVCTSADGREILEEFTTENSLLPDDIVYSVGYNTETNSLMISTAQGFAEYMLPVSQNSSQKEDIRAYPNPVRPEYSGFVTITDIPTGSFVKITDAAGNLVKDLGVMSGFEMLWDISDANFNRVKSGVYNIMISPSDENSSYSTVGKILVIS